MTNMQWFLPTMHNIRTTSLPNILFIAHLINQKKNRWSPFFYKGFSYIPLSFLRVFPISPFPLLSPHPYLSLSSPLAHHRPTSFLFFDNKLSYGFFLDSFMILTLLSFYNFPFNKETPKNNMPSTY
jgi:hypothetical protein